MLALLAMAATPVPDGMDVADWLYRDFDSIYSHLGNFEGALMFEKVCKLYKATTAAAPLGGVSAGRVGGRGRGRSEFAIFALVHSARAHQRGTDTVMFQHLGMALALQLIAVERCCDFSRATRVPPRPIIPLFR